MTLFKGLFESASKENGIIMLWRMQINQSDQLTISSYKLQACHTLHFGWGKSQKANRCSWLPIPPSPNSPKKHCFPTVTQAAIIKLQITKLTIRQERPYDLMTAPCEQGLHTSDENECTTPGSRKVISRWALVKRKSNAWQPWTQGMASQVEMVVRRSSAKCRQRETSSEKWLLSQLRVREVYRNWKGWCSCNIQVKQIQHHRVAM